MNTRAPARAQRTVHRTFRNFFRRFVVLGAGLLIAAAPLAAAADDHEDDDPFDRPGFYFGVGGSYQYNVLESQIEDAIDDQVDNGDLTIDDVDLDDSGGLNAMVGYRVVSFFAVELKYEWVDEYDVDLAGTFDANGGAPPGPISDSGTLYSIEGHTLTGNLKFIVPTWRIQPYFVLGGGFAMSDVERGDLYDDPITAAVLESEGIDVDDGKTWNPAGRAAVGIDWYITKNIVAFTEAGVVVTTLNKPVFDDIEDLNYMSFQGGLQYRF